MRFLGIKEKALPVVNVIQHNLSSYEQLLRGKEVRSEQYPSP